MNRKSALDPLQGPAAPERMRPPLALSGVITIGLVGVVMVAGSMTVGVQMAKFDAKSAMIELRGERDAALRTAEELRQQRVREAAAVDLAILSAKREQAAHDDARAALVAASDALERCQRNVKPMRRREARKQAVQL